MTASADDVPFVLAFHGFGGSVRELQPMLDRARAGGFDFEAPLLPGHGTSPDDLQHRTFAEWVAFARTRFDAALALHRRVVVLGFSMGSLVAIELALSGRACGLVVLGNALTLSPALRGGFGALDLLRVRAPAIHIPKPRPADMEDRVAARALENYDRHPLRAAREVYLAGQRLRGEVQKLDLPTLILHGKKDRVCPVANALWLAERIPHATVRTYARSAHVVAADYDREDVARDLVAFLDERAQRRPVEP